MKCQFVVNGGVTMVLSPENPLEEELLKTLASQTNEITEANNTTVILGHSMRSGLIVGKKGPKINLEEDQH